MRRGRRGRRGSAWRCPSCMASPLRWGAHSSLRLGEPRCSRGQAWPSLSYYVSRWRVVYCPPRTTSVYLTMYLCVYFEVVVAHPRRNAEPQPLTLPGRGAQGSRAPLDGRAHRHGGQPGRGRRSQRAALRNRPGALRHHRAREAAAGAALGARTLPRALVWQQTPRAHTRHLISPGQRRRQLELGRRALRPVTRISLH